ncbi:hypothetical protein [Streptacidiphilus sp. P02-A3a]|uniref:hypothetical protein n=1 Tax=Streptacidiphilus sp. P02-A3a TaxID=2704468 RepID=UPI0015FBC3F6|nr:hypothetical protein [Streptacidiphilus sp. P02-A3a]QMU69669.1 hypothetical protein GXP74_16910 [Streptacidiphilus sp. P02-A3a]
MAVSSQDGTGTGGGLGRDAVQLLAGIVDLGLEQAEAALRQVRGLLGRSDLRELAEDGHQELRTRGGLLLDRITPTSESHLEALARRSAAVTGPPTSDA